MLEHKKAIAAAFFFIFAVFLAASIYIREVQSDYVLNTRLQISEQETQLAALAELTDRDGADAVVERIIKDCSPENRGRFDTLLSKLGELNAAELKEIEQLFNACGNFYAERKAVMVARLEREYEIYLDFIEILSLVDESASVATYNVEGWRALVDKEKERSELSTKLVNIQGQIITALLENMPIASERMQLLMVEGQQTKERLSSLSTDIDLLRQEILDL